MKTIHPFIAFIVIACFSLCLVIAIEYDCGTGLKCSFEGNHFTVSGNGVMKNFSSYSDVEWIDVKGEIRTVSIETGVRSIGNFAFSNCTNLISIDVPNTVTVIGDYAFFDCRKMNTINISAGVTSIGNHAFDSSGLRGRIDLSHELKNIGERAFSDCNNIETVFIPSSVVYIGRNSFMNCVKLKSITVAEENINYASVDGVLCDHNCTTLMAYPPARTESSYVIPNGITEISEFAFTNCGNLKHVTIAGSVVSIENYAFYSCPKITELTIPDGVKSIGKGAFRRCEELKRVVIPESVTLIGDNAFGHCSSLYSVFYQGSATIASDIFQDCENLTAICASPYYTNTSFGGRTLTSEEGLCQRFRDMTNLCFKASFINGSLVQEKRMNATEFESRTNGCAEHRCINNSGFVSWSLCNNTNEKDVVCFNEECVDKKELADDKVPVRFDLEDGVDVSEMDTEQVLDAIRNNVGMELENVHVGYEMNEEGFVIRIIIYVENQDTAKIIADTMSSCARTN